MVDISRPNTPYSIYEELHWCNDGKQLTDEPKRCCRTYYGAPIRAFLRKIATYLEVETDRKRLAHWLGSSRQNYFRVLADKSKGLPLINRASHRFATVYAAGSSLAIRFGILPWTRGQLGKAILSCQHDQLKLEATDKGMKSPKVDLRSKLINYLRKRKDAFDDLAEGFLARRPLRDGKPIVQSSPGFIATFKGEDWFYLGNDRLEAIIGSGDAARNLKKALAADGFMDTSSGGGTPRFVVSRPVFRASRS
jgi:hypothetical protein